MSAGCPCLSAPKEPGPRRPHPVPTRGGICRDPGELDQQQCVCLCVYEPFLLTRSFYDSATPPEHGGPRTQGLGTCELLEQQKWLGDAYVLKDLLGPSRTTWRSDSYFGEAVTRPTVSLWRENHLRGAPRRFWGNCGDPPPRNFGEPPSGSAASEGCWASGGWDPR